MKFINYKFIPFPNHFFFNFDVFHEAANRNQIDVIYYLLLKEKEIGESCFEGNDKLSKIVIPPSIIAIRKKAFSYCLSLTHVSISPSVKYIVILPSSLNSIEANTFNECSLLKEITIPFTETSIGDCAFKECSSLKQILIPP